MNVSKLIKQHVVPKFKELNFYLDPQEGGWTFIRKQDGRKDFIEIDKSQWNKNSLRLSFYNSNHNISSDRLVNKKEPFNEWYSYTDEKSLIELLNFFIEIVQKYAIDWFLKYPSERIMNIFDPALLNKNNHEHEVQEFITQQELKLDEPTETISVIERILLNSPSDELLEKLTYVYGEVFIRSCGGEWSVSEENFPIVINFGGVKGFTLHPYNYIVSFIEEPELGELVELYRIKTETALR